MKKMIMVLAIFALTVVPAGAAFAISGSDGREETEIEEVEIKTAEAENEVEAHDEEIKSSQELQRETAKKAAEATREAAKDEAEERSERAKKAAEARQITVKKDRCEERKNKLTETVPRLSQGATSVKKTLDAKYQRVQDIYASGKLTAANYGTLKTAVDAAKLASETSMNMVTPSSFTIDCASSSLGLSSIVTVQP